MQHTANVLSLKRAPRVRIPPSPQRPERSESFAERSDMPGVYHVRDSKGNSGTHSVEWEGFPGPSGTRSGGGE